MLSKPTTFLNKYFCFIFDFPFEKESQLDSAQYEGFPEPWNEYKKVHTKRPSVGWRCLGRNPPGQKVALGDDKECHAANEHIMDCGIDGRSNTHTCKALHDQQEEEGSDRWDWDFNGSSSRERSPENNERLTR